MSTSRLALFLGAALLTAAAASAQTSVAGRVANAQGGIIANAEATIRALPPPGTTPMPNMPNMPNMPAPFERTATAGADGAFTLNGIPAGDYVLFVDATGFERSSQTVTVANQPQNLTVTLTPLVLPGAEEPAGAGGSVTDTAVLLERIRQLEQRLTDIESEAVLSEPETRVKRIEVAISKLSAGSRRPCCFDRSGMYDKSLSCPIPDEIE